MTSNLIWLFCGGFFLFAFFVGGVVSIIFGIRNRKKGEESQNWPGVSGTITNLSVQKDIDTDAEGFTTTSYKPEIEYQYQVGEEMYTSDRISFGGTSTYSSSKKAEQALEAYTLNGPVTVYYNPEKVDESVLQQGTKGTMALIIAGGVFLVISICGGCAGIYFVITNLFRSF